MDRAESTDLVRDLTNKKRGPKPPDLTVQVHGASGPGLHGTVPSSGFLNFPKKAFEQSLAAALRRFDASDFVDVDKSARFQISGFLFVANVELNWTEGVGSEQE